MSVGYSKEFNDATRPGFSPEAAEAAMRRLRDSEQIQEQQAFQRQVSGAAADAGEIASAAGAARRITEEADRAEKERKERTDRETLLAMLDDQIAQIDFQLDVGSSFAEDLANGIAPDLDEDGRIADEDREAFIRAYETRTGETVDRTDIEELRSAVDAQNAYLRQTRETAANLRTELDRSNPRAAAIEEGAILEQQVSAFISQHQAQSGGLAEDVSELSHVQEFETLEAEIEHFMQEYARSQAINDDGARLLAEQELVSSLSEEAADFISMGEDTEHLFEEGYFTALEVEEFQVDAPSSGLDSTTRPISPI